jgi:hypothetical protein
MHRLIQEHLEEVLAESNPTGPAATHLSQCAQCCDEVSALREQASLLRSLRAPEIAPNIRPGFYARVMERIEAQRPISIWELFFDSAFGRRIAIGAMALTVLFSVYLVSSEHYADQPITVNVSADDQILSTTGLPDKDAVLVNLVTYREQ